MLNEPREQFVSQLFHARNRVRFAMDEAFKPAGITDATWRTLFYLEQCGEAVAQKHLAEVMGIEGPSLVRLLDNLEAKDLIKRCPSQTDRRVKLVELTSAARELLIDLHRTASRVRAELLRDVSDAEINACLKVLECINRSEGMIHE
jgi:MarR family transcriptional regulator for hemolysin